MTDSNVTYQVEKNIGYILLNRAPVNAFSVEFLDEILSTLVRAGADDKVRAVILSSDIQDIFSAGLDLDILLGKSSVEIEEFLQRLYVQL